MRNEWYPARIADYVPFNELRKLKKQDISFERDYNFIRRRGRKGREKASRETVVPEVEKIKLLTVCAFYLIHVVCERNC
jgi:hypothetical protein